MLETPGYRGTDFNTRSADVENARRARSQDAPRLRCEYLSDVTRKLRVSEKFRIAASPFHYPSPLSLSLSLSLSFSPSRFLFLFFPR